MYWNCSHYKFDTRMPFIMGILNLTPDSFSDGGAYESEQAAIDAAKQMVQDGALIIDVGGESTRPGALPVTEDEELARVINVVRSLAAQDICVSIDTRHAKVAKACVEAGAAIINDVSGFRDRAMVDLAASCDAGLIVVHMQGTPENMQENPEYADVVFEVKDYLANRAEMLQEAGVDRSRICLDPGPGFGKTHKQTMELMRNMHEFRHLGYPLMVAVSRKSFIGWAYDIEDPVQRDDASADEALMACELGACVVRTHNVACMAEKLKLLRPYVLLGLGCNLPLIKTNPGEETEAKIAQLSKAIGDLCMLPDTQLIDISSFYESEPAYKEDQENFVNAVAVLRTGIPPRELLGYLHAIERSLGRVRGEANGPRTCDLDILDYQLYLVEEEVLTLPHPRIMERDFVVRPLLEILPGHILTNGVAVDCSQVSVGKAVKIQGRQLQ